MANTGLSIFRVHKTNWFLHAKMAKRTPKMAKKPPILRYRTRIRESMVTGDQASGREATRASNLTLAGAARSFAFQLATRQW
jgi:hypothetical protein